MRKIAKALGSERTLARDPQRQIHPLQMADSRSAAVSGSFVSERTMRILYIITRADRGGAQNHVLGLARIMAGQFDVAVAAGEQGYLTEACRNQRISVHILPHLQREPSPLADFRALREIYQLIRQFRPDLVHAHTSKAGFLGRLAAHWLGVPCVYTVHSWLFGTAALSRFWGIMGAPCERLASKWCQRVITVSDEGARVARSFGIGPVSKLVTIHNGILDCSEHANLNSDRPPIITMVARFCPPKDHALLLRAFATVPPGPRLRLVGDGPLRASCEKLAHDLGIYHRVDFLGDRDDVPSLLAGSDVFVLASNFEMLPISILEAMRAGLPVLASAVGGVAEAVVHGETGLLVPIGSVAALAQALTRLSRDRDLRLQLGQAGRQRFSSLFQYSRQVERTRSVYLDVLLESGRPVPEIAWEARAA